MPPILSVPNQITVADGEAIRRHLRSLVCGGEMGRYYPSVLVSYATSTRHGSDGPGCGPGMYYCKHLVELLSERGVCSFSGLHVAGGTDWHVFLEKLNSRFSKCQVLIVVVTPALFLSKPCLEEIYNALEAKIYVLPIIFEGNIPPSAQQWPMITADACEQTKLMLTKVTNEFCKLNTIPAPPGTVLQQPEALTLAVEDIVARLDVTKIDPLLTGVLPVGAVAVKKLDPEPSNSIDSHGHTAGRQQVATVTEFASLAEATIAELLELSDDELVELMGELSIGVLQRKRILKDAAAQRLAISTPFPPLEETLQPQAEEVENDHSVSLLELSDDDHRRILGFLQLSELAKVAPIIVIGMYLHAYKCYCIFIIVGGAAFQVLERAGVRRVLVGGALEG
eukprot:SAG31_NODE_438_length_15693_cov_6.254248_12_plen_395_part_00